MRRVALVHFVRIVSVLLLYCVNAYGDDLEDKARELYQQTSLSSEEIPFDQFYAGYQRFLRGYQDGDFKKSQMAFVNFSQPSSEQRFYLISVSGSSANIIFKDYVAHGSGSGSEQGDRVNPSVFSNTSQSHQSSLGFYKIGEAPDYASPNVGKYILVDGLSGSEYNSLARKREILIHTGKYVNARYAAASTSIGES